MPAPTMDTPQANAYLRTKVMSASPAELRLMLLDGSIKFACQARDGLQRKDFEASYAGFTQCRAIVLELLTTIDPDPNPELAENVKALYAFLYSELVESSMDKDIPRLGKVIELLEFERETWSMLMQQLAAEQGGTPEPRPSQPAAAPAPQQAAPRQPAPQQAGPRPAAPTPYGMQAGGGGLSLSA